MATYTNEELKEFCSCGAESHMDQVEKYPVGAKVILHQYGDAVVAGHCDDGRARFITANGGVQTFHYPFSWIQKTIAPPVEVTIEKLESEIERLRSEIAYLAYFHREANFGPAHTDVVMAIQAQYAEVHGVPVPEYWRYE